MQALDPEASPDVLDGIVKRHIGQCDVECCYGGDWGWLIFVAAAHRNLAAASRRFIFDYDTGMDGDRAKALAESLLQNPNCDPDIIDMYSNIYFDDWIVDLIYEHPNTPPSVIATYVEERGMPPR